MEKIVALSLLKLLWLPTYRSTDFEVHRNWLAITSSLPIFKWYQDETSQWTLDYPPLFAWFEYCLSLVARFFDRDMLVLDNLNYASTETVVFQKVSVVVTDCVLAYAVSRCLKALGKWDKSLDKQATFIFILVMTNAGLLLVDHLHFQYNGFLFGLLFISISCIIEGSHIQAAFWFSVLLNLKHIYLYMAPAVFIYLLRSYCFSSRKNGTIIWTSFSLSNIFKLGITVVSVFAASFGPFIVYGQLEQVLSRLFPFKRGLSHAYWAPNFWALYNFADKAAAVTGTKAGLLQNFNQASMTGGLVQEFHHSVLPSISPLLTFILTFLAMIPGLVKLWYHPNNPWQFVRTLVICSFCSYLFGWHVHEKAILLVTLPLGILSLLDRNDAHLFMLLNIIGNFSLFPLIFTPKESVIKVSMFLFHSVYVCGKLHEIWKFKSCRWYPGLQKIECIYFLGLFFVHLYHSFIHNMIPQLRSMEFLPLMVISVYCSVGILYIWIRYYMCCLATSIDVRLTDRKTL